MRLRPSRVVPATTVLLLLALAGCSAPVPEATPVAEPAPTATATPEPTATPAPAAAPTCESVLDPASVEAFTAQDYELSDDFAERSIEEGWPEAAFVTNGGLLCQWGYPNSDASEYYGLSSLPAQNAATIEARLTAEGFVAEAHGDGELYVGPPTEGIHIHYFFAGDHWFVGFSPSRVDEIRRNAGLS